MKKRYLAWYFAFLMPGLLAFPQAPFDALKSELEPPNYLDALNYDFEGIVKLSNCSGAIIKFKGQPSTDNAIVLTNGHCLGGRFLKPDQVVYKKRVRRRMRVANTQMTFSRINATEVIYGTMTDTDTAIYKLRETYEDLERLNIKALVLSDQRPELGAPIEIISGYWERGYACQIDAFIYLLREAEWNFVDSIRYSNSGCETIGGTSGSPIIHRDTREVIGVNNTSNERGNVVQ